MTGPPTKAKSAAAGTATATAAGAEASAGNDSSTRVPAPACEVTWTVPPAPETTPQTIGRLETGTRTVSVGWLNRIAKALGVDAQDLVEGGGEASELKVAAILGPEDFRSIRSDDVLATT